VDVADDVADPDQVTKVLGRGVGFTHGVGMIPAPRRSSVFIC
jgi:hypothetical protein